MVNIILREVVPLRIFALSWFSVPRIAVVLLTRRFSSFQIISIMFKSGDLGEIQRNLHCYHSDMQWWPLPDGLGHHRAAPAFLCGHSTME